MTPAEAEMHELAERACDKSLPHHERAKAARSLRLLANALAHAIDEEVRRAARLHIPKERPTA